MRSPNKQNTANRQNLVAVRVEIPRPVDRKVEEVAFRTEVTKRSIFEAALRAYLGMEDGTAA